jgi:alpha-aminoadipate carrier protein LysW
MPICPECDTPFDVDEDEVDEGEVLLCEECGAEYEIVSTDPLELSKIDSEGYEEDESEFGIASEEEDE